MLTETLDNTAAIFFEALINRRIRSRQSSIALVENMIRADHACKRCHTDSYGRAIKLDELNCGLSINNSEIFLAILFRILFCHRRVGRNLMDRIDLFFSFVDDLFNLESRLARHNRAGHNTHCTRCKQDLRAVLLDLKTRSIECTGQGGNDFSLVEFHLSFLLYYLIGSALGSFSI